MELPNSSHQYCVVKAPQWEQLKAVAVAEGGTGCVMPPIIRQGLKSKPVAVADVVLDYQTNGKRSLSHVERRIKLHLEPFFGGRRMANMTTSDVRNFIAERQKAGASNGEINRELAILKRAFRLAVQAGKLLYMPYIPMLTENNVRQGFFERQEFDDVRAALPTSLRGLVTFAFLTGWRTSEMLTLEWRQVDRQAGTVRLEPGTTKNAEGRMFPYGDFLPELRDVIEDQWARRERLAKGGRSSRSCSTETGSRSKATARHGTPPVSRRAARRVSRTTSAAPPCAISSGLASANERP
jgi:integrase